MSQSPHSVFPVSYSGTGPESVYDHPFSTRKVVDGISIPFPSDIEVTRSFRLALRLYFCLLGFFQYELSSKDFNHLSISLTRF